MRYSSPSPLIKLLASPKLRKISTISLSCGCFFIVVDPISNKKLGHLICPSLNYSTLPKKAFVRSFFGFPNSSSGNPSSTI